MGVDYGGDDGLSIKSCRHQVVIRGGGGGGGAGGSVR
jgi:hypothetical protein